VAALLPERQVGQADQDGGDGDGEFYDVPVVNVVVLSKLRTEQEHGEGVWTLFVQAFLGNLPINVDRLRQALTTGDLLGAREAVRMLETSAQMVGAERLAGLTLQLEHLLRNPAPGNEVAVLTQSAAAQLSRIRRAALQTEVLFISQLQGTTRPQRQMT
jgi:HPt (histidine-containing phosphotransfer) domain-containing protein